MAGFCMIWSGGGEIIRWNSVFCTHLLATQLQHCKKPCSRCVLRDSKVCPCQKFHKELRWPRGGSCIILGLRLFPENWFFWDPGQRAEVALSCHESCNFLDFITQLTSPPEDMGWKSVLVEIQLCKVQNFPTQTLVKIWPKSQNGNVRFFHTWTLTPQTR